MSTADTRAELAAAITEAVDVLNVTPYRRSNLTPYQGFVQLVRRQPDSSGLGWLDTWQVWVALPVDVPAAEAWTDEHLPQLLRAADAVLAITAAFPAELQTAPGAPTVPGLVLEGINPTV